MPQLEIRVVRPADHDEWVELYAGYRAFYDLAPDPEAVETAWRWVSTGQHQFTGLVAVDESGAVLALANVRDVARPSAGRMGLYLDDLFTAPAARGRGAGSALLERLAELARERDAVVVRWITSTGNETARRLYDRHAELREFASYDMAPAAAPTVVAD
ncbi:MAG TPA: GNAT family N-acetyltransferase [Pseudolysinimonas sp.]|jgi:GNAT superfamily N-acetyltransferase